MKIDKTALTRKIICTAVAFALSVCLMLTALIVTAYTACSKKYIVYIEEKSGYASLSVETLKTELADLTIPGGFPLDFFDTRLDTALYKERVSESLLAPITGAPLSYNIDSVTKEFYDITAEYVLAEDGEIVPEVDEGLHGLSSECAKVYIKYSNPSSLKLVFKYFPSLQRILVFAALAVALLLIASAVFLFFLCRGRDLLKHLIFSLSGAALLSGVLPLILLVSKEIKRISLTLPALHSFAVSYIEGLLIFLCSIASVFLLAAIVIAAIKLVKFLKTEKSDK